MVIEFSSPVVHFIGSCLVGLVIGLVLTVGWVSSTSQMPLLRFPIHRKSPDQCWTSFLGVYILFTLLKVSRDGSDVMFA